MWFKSNARYFYILIKKLMNKFSIPVVLTALLNLIESAASL